jgi:hypothetical protein
MTLAGGAILPAFRGQTIHRIVSQLDFAATLLPQLGMDASAFYWSKNILATHCPEFAYYVYPTGMGWLRPNGSFVAEYARDVLEEEEFPERACRDSILKEGRAYLQHAQQAYLDL